MKLKLKHLAPYLPYDLKLKQGGYILTMDAVGNGSDYMSIDDVDEYAKPILRPLSDLNPNEFVKKHYSNLGWLEKIKDLQMIQAGKYNPLYCDYEIVQNLISDHYDVFGLIEKGLAIDINTVNS